MSSTDRSQLPEPLGDTTNTAPPTQDSAYRKQRRTSYQPQSYHYPSHQGTVPSTTSTPTNYPHSSSSSSNSTEGVVLTSVSRSSTSSSSRKRRMNDEGEESMPLTSAKKMKKTNITTTAPSQLLPTPPITTTATATTANTVVERLSWQVENLQRQIAEMSENFCTERGKLREQVIMHTFQLRMNEDEWISKERSYIQQIEQLKAEIERLRSQLTIASTTTPTNTAVHDSGASALPSLIRTSSPSSSISMVDRQQQSHLPKNKNEISDDDTDRSMCDVSDSSASPPKVTIYSFDMSKEREAVEKNGPPPSYHDTCCPIGVAELREKQGENMRFAAKHGVNEPYKQLSHALPSQLPDNNEKIPSISSILPMPVDLGNVMPYDNASRMVGVIAQKDDQIQEQIQIIEKLQSEIATLKEYNTKLSSKQSREQRGNRLGKRYDFPKEATTVLKKWITEHMQNPYPTKDEKEDLSKETGLTVTQLNDWFTNYRRRHLRSTPSEKGNGTSSQTNMGQNYPTVAMTSHSTSPSLKTESLQS